MHVVDDGIKEGIKEIGKTIRGSENTEQSQEITFKGKIPSWSKIAILLITVGIFVVSVYVLFKKPMKIPKLINILNVYFPYYTTLTIVVGGGSALKNYWKRDRL